MFEGMPTCLKIRELTYRARETYKRRETKPMPNDDGKEVRDLALLLKLREGGSSFASGVHEEFRAAGLKNRGLLTGKESLFRLSHSRAGEEVREYRTKWTITEQGTQFLASVERHAAVLSPKSRKQASK